MEPAPAIAATAKWEVATPGACLLCGRPELEVTDSFSTADIRKGWGVFGVHFPKGSLGAFEQLASVDMFRCRTCGFQFCSPELAGDGQFYAELERQKKTYYPPDVPEFRRTLGWAGEFGWRTLLDVGCGEGAFLDLARSAGLEVAGVELNLEAAKVCRGRGHTVHTRPLAELGQGTQSRGYDLVTVFQVLEHVSDPVGFLGQAAKLVAPGGALSVAVPNESGIYRICPREPHQWPPHHVTRWRLEDLRELGRRCGFAVLAAGANQLGGLEIEHFWRVHNQIAHALGLSPRPGGKILPRLVSLTYRALGLRHLVRGMGTSVYALYRVPAP
jgi:SAM-dependent methyltransferase